MYIYHALINALSAHMIYINLNMIFYMHVEHSPIKTIYIKYYTEKQTNKQTNKHTHTHTHTDNNNSTHSCLWKSLSLRKLTMTNPVRLCCLPSCPMYAVLLAVTISGPVSDNKPQNISIH